MSWPLENSTIGLSGVTLGRLADTSGLSKSGLFAHFRSKEQLQIDLLDETVRTVERIVVQPAMQAAAGLPRLDMTEHFIPETFALVNEGVEIEAAASRYDKTAREINAAFYTPAIADRAGTRVEV